MKIAILDDYQDRVRHLKVFSLLNQHEVKIFNNTSKGVGQLAIRLAQYDALVLIRERTEISAALLKKLPNLKLISQTGKVSGHIDVETATQRGVVILEGAGDPTAPAELTWALIMAASRRIVPYASNLKQGRWQNVSMTAEKNLLGRTLKGSTLGVWGYGKIGKIVAGYGKAFGMYILIWGREKSRIQALKDGHQVAESKQQFFASADIVSVHLRLNEATHGIVKEKDLEQMKTDALFVNTSRAELVEKGALASALNNGRPGQAAIDVFEDEPVQANTTILGMENILATPHLGYVEQNSYELYFGAAFQNILDYTNGETKSVLNHAALNQPRDTAR